jgi:choline-sulfatase
LHEESVPMSQFRLWLSFAMSLFLGSAKSARALRRCDQQTCTTKSYIDFGAILSREQPAALCSHHRNQGLITMSDGQESPNKTIPPQVRSIPRRELLQNTFAVIASASLGGNRAFGISRLPKKPNILWIMSDEHNSRIAGCYGNTLIQTPNIDSLAERGVRFANHYCNSPLCVPSRASLTAGKYCSRVNVWNNECELPAADIPTLPRALNAAGYESYLCGKQHYDFTRRYGFKEIGGNFNNNFKSGTGFRIPADDLSQSGLSPRFKEFHAGDNGYSVRHDRAVTTGAVDFLQKRAAADKPFFLYAGYLAPHFPLTVPQANWDRYKGKLDLPDIPEGYLDHLPLNYKHLRASFGLVGTPDDVTVRGRELYYGLTDWVDGQIGQLLAALRQNPAIAENTVIVYSSDHGENMGEHGLWWKNSMHEDSSHVPLIVSWPQRWKAGQVRSGVSSHVDLVKAVVEIGGGRPEEDWNGHSLLPLLDNPRHAWKDYAVSEYYAHNVASGYVMARSGPWKYTYHTIIDQHHPAQRELYNVDEDPKEFTNLADRPEHAPRIAHMHQEMVKEVGGDPDETEQRARAQLARGYGRTDKDQQPPEKGTWQG